MYKSFIWNVLIIYIGVKTFCVSYIFIWFLILIMLKYKNNMYNTICLDFLYYTHMVLNINFQIVLI